MRSQIVGFFGALAVVVSSAYAAASVWAVAGVTPPPSPPIVAIAVVVVLLAVAQPAPDSESWHIGAWLGVGAGLAGALGLELIAGTGLLTAGTIGASIGAAGAIPALTRCWSGRSLAAVSRLGMLALFALVAVALIRSVIDGGALGHDEAAYALKARSWLAGTPDTGWALHRAPLISLLGIPAVWLTHGEVPLRAVGVALALGSLGAVASVAAKLAGRWGALLAAATVGASLSFLRRGSEFLTDVAAAGLLLLLVWVTLTAIRDPDRNGRRLLWIAPLIAAAFFMRYQSALGVVGIGTAAALAWPREVARLRRPLVLAGAITVGLLTPHLVWSTIVTGSPWGVVLFTRDVAARGSFAAGLIDLARMFPLDLAGPAGAILGATGLVWAVWRAARCLGGSRDMSDRVGLFVAIVAFVAVVPLGLVTRGEPRFYFFPMWLLIAVGAGVIVRTVSSLDRPQRLSAIGLAVVLWLPLMTETVERVDTNAEFRARGLEVVVDASEAIRLDGSGSCAVLTTYLPQVSWYSGCSTSLFDDDAADLGVDALDGQRRYALLFENGKREPAGATRTRYLELGSTSTIPAADDQIGEATIVRIASDR